ncbi:Predicted DNA-binding transcriptional regulator YafY, contains an HTH and WYL domains [Devosia sp. YR412]|uniref:helix-turn-helix transcriptional regulator n=1 Tax=Devosia sp. YR412 TaxID=1881030 RepID=UPI0008C169E6|nr:WYL domain-containing protein [Devosia sp. YR412]SEP82147.1 Predicted DNA-binding transcriptional regulator YafY, contains an HTH and WYL domains [Devosia sp. YR412]
MAYEKAKELLDLALLLASSRYGMSATEIEHFLANKGRGNQSSSALIRQRQRMLNQLDELFGPALEMSIDADDGRWRWSLRTKDLANLPLIDPADLAAIEHATQILSRLGDRDSAERLSRINILLQTTLDARRRASFEVDFEALRDSQTIVAQPGPQIEVSRDVEQAVSEAILKGRCLEFVYQNRDQKVRRSVEPVGVLLGPRKYLIARSTNSPEWADANHWRMDKILEPRVSDQPARSMPEGFTLADHARRCFGVFWREEEYQDVEWRFAARAAVSAANWRFHPDQTVEQNSDGSITVRFKASGHYEMAWHLYQWGDAVQVIAPKALAKLVEGYQRADFTALP